jgi:hypothetical protein
MPTKSPANATQLRKLTDDEAITLRRIAFGQSEARALRREDIDRLLGLDLIVESGSDISLTASGKKHFDLLPTALFAGNSRAKSGW